MTQYCREHTFRIITGQGKCISVADAGMGDFYQYFTLTRRLHINFNDLEGLTEEQMLQLHVISYVISFYYCFY